MVKSDVQRIVQNHLITLENAAQKQCSGEDLKAITEAMEITVMLILRFGFSEMPDEKYTPEELERIERFKNQ